jgi:hypothetical protein
MGENAARLPATLLNIPMTRGGLFCAAICWLVCASTNGQSGITSNGTLRKSVSPAGGPGSSYKQALIIYASDESSGVGSEYRFLSAHFPGAKEISRSREYYSKTTYDVITFVAPDGNKRAVYFDYRIHKG